jgi:hypothetical protein
MGQIKEIEKARLQWLECAPEEKPHVMVRLLACVIGVGIETANMPAPRPARSCPAARRLFLTTILCR